MSTGTLVMSHPQASYWQLPCLKKNTLINDVEKKNYSTHNPKLKKWCLWLVEGAWKRLTAKSKSGHWSQEQNAAPNTVLYTQHKVHKLHTIFCFHWNQKTYQRSFVGICGAFWDEQFQWSIFFCPFPLFFCWAPNFMQEKYKSIDFVVSDLFSHLD